MNSNRRVLIFVLASVSIYLLLSFAGSLMHVKWLPFRRINLISDIIKKDSFSLASDTSTGGNNIVLDKKPQEDFNLYTRANYITGFYSDTLKPTMPDFLQKLLDLKSGKKRKVRVAYFGDSMIEGDLISQTLRKRLQQYFGGSGVGFVPITSQVASFRQSAYASFSSGWQDENFKNASYGNKLFISGHLFRGTDDWVQMTDHTISDSAALIEKSLLCGYDEHSSSVTVNGSTITIHADNTFNRIPIEKDNSAYIRLAVSDPSLPVYGISFETDAGVFVDNFSFRGISGIEYAKTDSNFLKSVSQNNTYDLIIFQYGVNVLERASQTSFGWYTRAIAPVVAKLKRCFPQADFIIESTGDRAMRIEGELQTPPGIDSLVKMQAHIAYQTNSYFYNLYESMGGSGSMVNWVEQRPSLGEKDYVHPTMRGSEVLGNIFFDAIMKEYEKFVKRK